MSQLKKQPQPRMSTTKDPKPKVVYFKKQFKLMIHNITLEQQIRSTVYSLQSANYTSIPHAVFHITINSTVDITTIDMTSNQEERADLEATLDLSHFAKGIKNDLAIVKFQVAKEKILAPASVNFYTQPLANRKGTIQYKFVGQKVTEIDEEQFLKHNVRRDEIIQIEKQLAQNPQLKRLVQILDKKDQIIKTLQKKIASLIEQTRKLTHNLQRQTSEQRKRLRQGLNLNLNVNASNNYHMKRLNEKLSEENAYLQKRLQAVEQQLESTEKQLIEYRCENNILQIEIGKKSMIDGPTINLNPSKSIIEQNRHMLQKIQEQQYDQELERKSKMADSFFLPGDDSSVRSKMPTGRRANHTMTMNASNMPGLTPRGNSKGRTKSVIDPSIVNNLQQQLNQSKLIDSEQVQLELNELKDLRENMENKLLQAVPQQDGHVRYPRLQAAIKSSYRVMQRLNQQKNLLEQKLKRREQQIQYLRRQLQKSKQNFKNFEKQLRQRSSNAKDQFEQRMAAIKLQTQMKMAEMRRQNRFSDYESVMQTEKRQIQIEKMRYENDALREKYQEAMNELRNLQLQKASEQNKYKTVQAAINKEKEMYKSKYYEMQDSFTKQEEELQVTKDKAKMYELHVARIEELQKVEDTLKSKIQKEQKQIQELKNKIKRYEDKFTEIQPKWEYYRQMQHEFELVKKKNDTITKLNDRFQSRMEQIKKFASRLENAYYEKRQKNQSEFQFDEHYKKQLEQRLQATFKKLRAYQREFYEEQMKELTETKKQLIEFYYKRIVEESQRIDDNPTYTQADKQKFKNEKQHEINIVKEGKLDELDKQFKKYESAFGKLVSTQEYLPKGLNEKISYLQQKMRKFQMGEFGTGVLSNASQSIMKNTLDRLTDSIKDKQSQITELKRTIGKMSDGSSLLKVNNVQIANQRKSMIEEMQKSREIFTKSLEDLKKANQELLKQKSQLEIQVQNYRFREEKLIFKNTQREKQLQRVSKKNTDQFKKKISQLQKALEKKNDQNLKNKILKEQFEQHTKQLVSEVNNNSSLLEKLQQDLKNSEQQNQQLKSRLELYHEAQKILLQQVDAIKNQADIDIKAFKALLEERNAEFQKIKHIKEVEIEKLNKTIQEYEFRIQTQVNEYLHTRRDLEVLQDKYNELEAQLQETKVSFNVVNENYHKVEEDSVLKIHELEEANVMLQTNLMEMAETLKEKQMQLHQAKIKQQSLEKQIIAISSIKQQLSQQQGEFLQKQKHYQELIEQLTEKLSTLQKKYVEISDKVHEVQRENGFVNCKLIEKDSQVEELRDKLNKKYDEINQVKSVKFDVEMKVKQMTMEIEEYQMAQEKDKQYISQLEEEVEELRNHVESLENDMQQQQMQKSRLKPPPRTNLMSGSAISDNDLGATRMNKSIRPPNNQINKSTLNPKNQVRETQQSQQTNIQIQQAESIRVTNLNTPTDLNFQASGPNRFRIWTVNETQEELRSPSRKHEQQGKNSMVNVDLSENSNEDPNLESDMSARQKELIKSQKVFRTMVKQQHEENGEEQSIVIDQNVHQVESYGSTQLVEQYMKEIQILKEEIDKLVDDKRFLQEENSVLKDRINELTGNVQESQRKNLLASALGLTGGLFMRQQGQRSSVESNNQENPMVPKLKMKSIVNVSPGITSKQAIKIQDNNRSYHGSIQGSRKSSILSPNRSPKHSPRQRQRQNSRKPVSGTNLARSSVGDIISTRKQSLQQHVEQQNEHVKQLQLMLHEAQEQNKQLKAALDDEHAAVEQLMEEIQVVQQAEEEKHRLLEDKARQIEQLTQYYEGIRVEMEKRVEKLVEQGMEKESQQIKLLKTFQAKNQQIQTLVNKIQRLERQIHSKSADITKLAQQKQKAYKEFRKYQQESQLEILKLKQQMTYLTELTQKKHSQVQLLAEDYFEMNNQLTQLKQSVKEKDIQLHRRDQKLAQLTKTHNDLVEQTKKTEQQKRNLRQRIHELQNDLVSYQTNMLDNNKATSLTIKKYQIKLNTSEQEKTVLKDKIHERETTIQTLKHTIALYNDETEQMKTVNKQLTLQLERTQAQLKDIMKSYESEFSELNLNLQASNENLSKVKGLLNEKDQEIHKLTKCINSLECDTRAAFNSQMQVKQAFEKYKSAKHNQVAHLLAQVQLKNDQYQKIKCQYQKESHQFSIKEQEYMKRLSVTEESKKTYKQKLIKYQTVLEQLEKQLEIMSMRPTKQQFDQVEFQNSLYKNRIQQLQQMLREFAPQASHSKQHSQQSLQHQFKKYKIQKERELDDLSNQIDKYCQKINQLEEANFMLKKQVEKLRQEIKAVLEENDGLKEENFDLKEDLQEMREEIQFYKGKRIQNLSKLLNQTM